MDRRNFLKLSGLLSAAVFMQFNSLEKAVSFPVEVEAQGKLFRGTSDGKIYISANAGKSWQLHTNFGSAFYIFGLADDWGQVHAQLGFEGHSFELALIENGKTWRTV
jgi:hypothetical protein